MTRCFSIGVLVALLAGCASVPAPSERVVTIIGSDTMLILNRRLAEDFMRSHPGVAVNVDGGGTSTGVDALIGGTASICAASRPLTPSEVRRLYDRHRTLGVRSLVAQDALSVWVHPENPVTELSMNELAGVFSGRLANWKEVGGKGGPITVVVRPPASGTYRFFRDRVLAGGAYSGGAAPAATTRDVVDRVAGDPGAVGFGGAAYRTGAVRACAVDGVLPTEEATREGRYPLNRHLVFVTVAPPEGVSRGFIDWCQGPEGQAVVAEIGYLPLWGRR